jgi:threonine aldolase
VNRGFASDNAATVHPQVLDAITAANQGHAFGYGHDALTASVQAQFAAEFGDGAQAFPVFNGSGANVVAIRAACRPYQGVICTDTAHINVDECGAPEAIAGVKLLTVPHRDGKLTPEALERRIARVGDEHAVQPHLVSISQATELGTVYTAEEISTLSRVAHEHDLRVHLDGARLANAAAALGVPLRALTTDAGVDLISFGATKNGALAAEAVVVLQPDLAGEMLFLRKQTLQLASKMRFIAAQLGALLTGGLWRQNAAHANAMAARLAEALGDAVEITRPVHANAVFARLPASVRGALHERYDFYDWDEGSGEVRWMCAWDTTEADVDEFAAAIGAALERRTED